MDLKLASDLDHSHPSPLVVAHDAPACCKAASPFICDGSNDYSVLQEAISVLVDSETVHLTVGTFDFGSQPAAPTEDVGLVNFPYRKEKEDGID